MNVSFEEIKANIEKRDYLDQTRKISPLVKAEDAIELDNSMMTPDQQMNWFKSVVKSKKILD